MKRWIFLISVLLCFSAPSLEQPKDSDSAGKQSGDLRHKAARVTEPIKIDGLINETAWTAADVLADFYQQEPKEGETASEKTEIRVLFDDNNIYFGIRAFDSEPSKINAREFVRDSAFANDDKVEIILDTFESFAVRFAAAAQIGEVFFVQDNRPGSNQFLAF